MPVIAHTFFYHSHYALHHRCCYRHHVRHHEWTQPSAISAGDNSLINSLLCDFPTLMLSPLLVGLHQKLILFVVFPLGLYAVMIGHGAWEDDFSTTFYFGIIPGSSSFHTVHHIDGRYNFASDKFPHWDRFYGTAAPHDFYIQLNKSEKIHPSVLHNYVRTRAPWWCYHLPAHQRYRSPCCAENQQ